MMLHRILGIGGGALLVLLASQVPVQAQRDCKYRDEKGRCVDKPVLEDDRPRWVVIFVSPPEAKVRLIPSKKTAPRIGKRLLERRPIKLDRRQIQSGKYRLRIEAPNHAPIDKTITVKPRGYQWFDESLAAHPRLEVTSEPVDARVKLERLPLEACKKRKASDAAVGPQVASDSGSSGNAQTLDLGKTPLENAPVSPGCWRLLVYSQGYVDFENKVRMKLGRTYVFGPVLQPKRRILEVDTDLTETEIAVMPKEDCDAEVAESRWQKQTHGRGLVGAFRPGHYCVYFRIDERLPLEKREVEIYDTDVRTLREEELLPPLDRKSEYRSYGVATQTTDALVNRLRSKCDKGNRQYVEKDCFHAALLLRHFSGKRDIGEKNTELLFQQFSRLCEDEMSAACEFKGWFLAHGEGVALDEDKARSAYDLACEIARKTDDKLACYRLYTPAEKERKRPPIKAYGLEDMKLDSNGDGDDSVGKKGEVSLIPGLELAAFGGVSIPDLLQSGLSASARLQARFAPKWIPDRYEFLVEGAWMNVPLRHRTITGSTTGIDALSLGGAGSVRMDDWLAEIGLKEFRARVYLGLEWYRAEDKQQVMPFGGFSIGRNLSRYLFLEGNLACYSRPEYWELDAVGRDKRIVGSGLHCLAGLGLGARLSVKARTH